MARHDALLAAEGTVLLIERLSPALEYSALALYSARTHTLSAARRAGRATRFGA